MAFGSVNSFAPLKENQFTRKWGGNASSVDPYITGYFFTHFLVPEGVTGSTALVNSGSNHNGGQVGSIADINAMLSSACLSVTIPGGTLNRADFTGLGGIKWGAPTNVDYDNTVTCRFLEFSGLPMLAIFHSWVRMIRDYRYGISAQMKKSYTKQNYAGILYYWNTQPDGISIEYANCCTGLFPLKDPQDQYGGDITAYDKLELDIDFNVDYMWHENWVFSKCFGFMDSKYNDGISKVNGYEDR